MIFSNRNLSELDENVYIDNKTFDENYAFNLKTPILCVNTLQYPKVKFHGILLDPHFKFFFFPLTLNKSQLKFLIDCTIWEQEKIPCPKKLSQPFITHWYILIWCTQFISGVVPQVIFWMNWFSSKRWWFV